MHGFLVLERRNKGTHQLKCVTSVSTLKCVRLGCNPLKEKVLGWVGDRL